MFYDAISESLHLGKQAAMGKKQLSDFYNAKHFCFDESTRACLRTCGFHSSFCYTDDLSIGPLIPYDSSDQSATLSYT